MDTPDKNRISAVSFCNFEDSPVFQYINDLSPIEPVKPARPENILHSLALTSPSSLFSSPQINSYRDSRFSIKRHRSLDLSSPVILIRETVKDSLDALEAVKISGLCEEQLKQLRNVSETKPIKEQISLAIELANSLNNRRGVCDIQMVSCDQVTMDGENEIGRAGSRELSDELCRQFNDPLDFDADSDGVLQTEETEAESGHGAEKVMFDVAGIHNSEQQIPRITNPRFDSLASEPLQFSLSRNNSESVEEPGGSCSVQVVAGVPDITLSILSNVAAIDSSAKAEDKKKTGHQPSRKQRSVRRRCLTFDMGGSYKRIPLRDSTNDLPLDFTSVNKAPSPQKCLDTSKQDADEILPIPQTIGMHLNGLMNPSVSNDQNKLIFKYGRVFPHGPTTFHHNTEDEFSTPVSTNRELVTCNTKIMEAPERSMEGECFDKHMPAENRQLSQGLDGLGSCKRCRCRKSKCLKLCCSVSLKVQHFQLVFQDPIPQKFIPFSCPKSSCLVSNPAYCECFAAGLYCIEPCICQNCFNKPIHEDIVIKTRELIEARNPLAFAPKVVSSSGSAIDIWDENIKTPASARHARGCNCRKSGCSKKYCDCYMMGVGCSSSCRCIGCKNIYGHTNEQCDGESDAVTINDEAKDNGDHGYASWYH